MAKAKRKLAAILNADMVGYSRLMSERAVAHYARRPGSREWQGAHARNARAPPSRSPAAIASVAVNMTAAIKDT